MGTDLQRMDLTEMQRWAKVFVASGMFGKESSAEVGIAKAVVRIQAGAELGIGPFASMNGIDIIDGQPAPNGALLAALVQLHPVYSYRLKELSDVGCAITFFENGEEVGISTFTEEDARQAGLTGKTNWSKYKKAMLFWRAMTQGVRMFAPSVTMGRIYSDEELGADVPMSLPVEAILEAEDDALDDRVIEGTARPTENPPTPTSEGGAPTSPLPRGRKTRKVNVSDGQLEASIYASKSLKDIQSVLPEVLDQEGAFQDMLADLCVQRVHLHALHEITDADKAGVLQVAAAILDLSNGLKGLDALLEAVHKRARELDAENGVEAVEDVPSVSTEPSEDELPEGLTGESPWWAFELANAETRKDINDLAGKVRADGQWEEFFPYYQKAIDQMRKSE